MKVRDLNSPVGGEEGLVFSDENLMSVQDLTTPGSNHHLTPSPPLAKVPGCYASIVPTPPLLSSQDKTNKSPVSEKKTAVTPLRGEGKKGNIRGRRSPIPPPRAVLSSPDNDAKFGSHRSRGYITSPLSQVKLAKPEDGKNRSCMKTREERFDKNRHIAKPTNTGRILKESGNQCH